MLSEIDMRPLRPTQSSTPEAPSRAGSAIDGDPDTYAKAGATKIQPVAWWKVDMKTNYYVKGVAITSAPDPQGRVQKSNFRNKYTNCD